LLSKGCGSFGHLASPDAQVNSALDYTLRSCDARFGSHRIKFSVSCLPTTRPESSDPQRTDERRNPGCHMYNLPAKQDLPHNGAESIDFLAGNRHGMPTSL
jgi:hypothetical protein